jgi:hypothetical protein
VQARLIGQEHDARRISAGEAISRFEKLLKEDPDHVLAREFYHIALHLRDVNAVLEGLRAGNTSYAIAQARRSPVPVRERTAQSLTSLAVKAIEQRDLSPMAAREMVVAAKGIYSGSASLRELYRAFQV